ncbi:MAG TPA: SAM-dependent methyltransferase, partial [Chthoniobacterales bacterium]|nr:SAM-dependent methyltransferase [Chthoniobacterales bacterium]
MLYIVGSPIGNLSDISLRALEVLRQVNRIAAEDTRRVRILLNHYSIEKPLLSYHEFNEAKRTAEIIQYLEQGESIALVSDAGMPSIS